MQTTILLHTIWFENDENQVFIGGEMIFYW